MNGFNSGLSVLFLVTHPDVAIQKITQEPEITQPEEQEFAQSVPLGESRDQPQVNCSNSFALRQVGSPGKMHEVTENFLYEAHLNDLLRCPSCHFSSCAFILSGGLGEIVLVLLAEEATFGIW